MKITVPADARLLEFCELLERGEPIPSALAREIAPAIRSALASPEGRKALGVPRRRGAPRTPNSDILAMACNVATLRAELGVSRAAKQVAEEFDRRPKTVLNHYYRLRPGLDGIAATMKMAATRMPAKADYQWLHDTLAQFIDEPDLDALMEAMPLSAAKQLIVTLRGGLRIDEHAIEKALRDLGYLDNPPDNSPE